MQHQCIIFVDSTCCSFIVSALDLPIPLAAAPLHFSFLLLPLVATPLCLLCSFHLLQHHCCCICSTAFVYYSTIVSAMLLPPAATQLHLLCCFHLLQHHWIYSAAFSYCSTTASSLLLRIPLVAVPLYHLYWFHLLQQHHCIIFGPLLTHCCSTSVSTLLLPLAAFGCIPYAASTPFNLLCCFHLLQHHCNDLMLSPVATPLHLPCSFHLLQLRCINSAHSTCRCTAASALLLSPSLTAPPPLHLHPWSFHLLQHSCSDTMHGIPCNSACCRFVVLSLLHPPASAPPHSISLLPPEICFAASALLVPLAAFALLLLPVAALPHLLCCFHLLQHHCIDLLCCFHLLQHHCIFLRCFYLLQHHCICSVASVYCSTVVSSM